LANKPSLPVFFELLAFFSIFLFDWTIISYTIVLTFCEKVKNKSHTGVRKFLEVLEMKARISIQSTDTQSINCRISVCNPIFLTASLLLIISMQGQLLAESTMNYPDRKALIVNNCPHVQLSNFWYENRYERSIYRFVQYMTWTNTGGQAIVAFDIVILKYNAFNERLNGVRWTVTGNNGQDWKPLEPGYRENDSTCVLTTEDVFTGIAYVRAVRLKDGTIWRADMKELKEKLGTVAPDINEFGNLNGEIKLNPNQ
jgi:hypothetical protein